MIAPPHPIGAPPMPNPPPPLDPRRSSMSLPLPGVHRMTSGAIAGWGPGLEPHTDFACAKWRTKPAILAPLGILLRDAAVSSGVPTSWGCSSVGRAPESHSGGHRFDPVQLHHNPRSLPRQLSGSTLHRGGKRPAAVSVAGRNVDTDLLPAKVRAGRVVNRLIIAIILSVLVAPMSRAADDVAVSVRVWLDDGAPAQNAYVALVPVWRPWSAPLAEAIAENGTHVFTVPKGIYFFVAGVRGYELASEGPFTLLSDSAGNANAQLKPVKKVSGVVVDEEGRGLVGIRVSQSRAVMAPPFGTSSKLAISHLSADWTTMTDADGRWTLAMPDGTVPMLFAAEGYAPQWRLYKRLDTSTLNVAIHAGAGLRVSCDHVDPDLVLSLEREGTDQAGSIPHNWQRQLWAQWMTGNTLAWSSLPPGNYAVYARYVDSGFFMDQAVKIGAASLAEGKTTTIQVTLPPARPRAKSIVQLFLEHAKVSSLKDIADAVATDS